MLADAARYVRIVTYTLVGMETFSDTERLVDLCLVDQWTDLYRLKHRYIEELVAQWKFGDTIRTNLHIHHHFPDHLAIYTIS